VSGPLIVLIVQIILLMALLELGSRVPDETQAQLRQMLSTDVPISHLRHYVDFLNSWRSGDYPASFDSLHRYFDYTMHNRDRTFYQYALLNLAILQADFGCHRESVLAMQETINTARENKDMACLNFALSWLYHFHRAHPQDCPDVIASRMERESLQFLKAKAKEWGMDHLLSMAYLSETRQALLLVIISTICTLGDPISRYTSRENRFQQLLKVCFEVPI
jgi:anaphase-promoting complex subunit 5